MYVAEVEVALASMVFDATGRADHNVGAVLQGTDLRPEGHAAAQRKDLDVVNGPRQLTQFTRYLICQFTSRA